MSEDNNRRNAEEASAGNSSDNMDLDDSDDDEFQMAIDAPVPPVAAMPRVVVGPHRVQSHDGMVFPDFLFNSRSTRRFVQDYRVLSARHLEFSPGHQNQNLESGGKVLLPQDALAILSRNSNALLSPMMFKVINHANRKVTHCGVLEFTADERTCYMPSWMMEHLGANDRDMIQIERVELPTADFVKFQAQSVDFLEISDQRAILENTLRQFACLTKGDMIAIHYNSRVYKLCVLEILPADAVTIIDCNLNVDFAAPVGYVSPSLSDAEENEAGDSDEQTNFSPFVGTGKRLNGKTVGTPISSGKGAGTKKGVPDTDWTIGKLTFKRKFRKLGKENSIGPKFMAFGGMGLSLKTLKKSKTSDAEPNAS